VAALLPWEWQLRLVDLNAEPVIDRPRYKEPRQVIAGTFCVNASPKIEPSWTSLG
jgi:hypothetical protein